jgi:hypothetical protein
MEVKNPKDDNKDWILVNKGSESAIWKYLTTSEFKKK